MADVCLVRCKAVVCRRINLASHSHDLVTKDGFIFILGRLSFVQKEPDGTTIEDTELCLQTVLRRLFPCKLKDEWVHPEVYAPEAQNIFFPFAWNFS